jgi:hypothetical protein
MEVMTHPRPVAITALAAAVLTAYGFSAKKGLLAQQIAPNLDVAARIEKSNP